MSDETKESEISGGGFEAAYVAAELELKALNRKLLIIWGCLTGAVVVLVVGYLLMRHDESLGLELVVGLSVAALICGVSVVLGIEMSVAKNRRAVLPVLAAGIGLDGTARVANMYNREGMIKGSVRCFATIADKQDRFLVQVIEAKGAGEDRQLEFEGIALRARCPASADDIMIRRKDMVTRVLDWFSRGPWEYDAHLNAHAPHPRFGIYVRRGSSVSLEAYGAFAKRIEQARQEADLGTGFGGAYCTRGWVNLLIDGSPRNWLDVGNMFDGLEKRAERAKRVLAEIAELARGGQALLGQFNDQSS